MRIKFDMKMKGMPIAQTRATDQAKQVLWLAMHKMQQLAKQYVPVDTGLLRRSINLHPIVEGSKEYVLADGVEYGEAIEYGTDPHIIRPKTKKALSFEWTDYGGTMLSKKGRRELQAKHSIRIMPGKAVFKVVHHPGTTAQPFFRPALLEVKTVWLKKIWAAVMAQAR